MVDIFILGLFNLPYICLHSSAILASRHSHSILVHVRSEVKVLQLRNGTFLATACCMRPNPALGDQDVQTGVKNDHPVAASGIPVDIGPGVKHMEGLDRRQNEWSSTLHTKPFNSPAKVAVSL